MSWLADNWVVCMNYVAWAISAAILAVIFVDFIRVEMGRRSGDQ